MLFRSLNKGLARINWTQSALDIYNLVRGFNPWPIAHTAFEGEMLKVFDGYIISQTDDEDLPVGSIVKLDKSGIVIKTGMDYFVITELQLGSHKRMHAQAFLLGKNIELGTKLE